MANSFPTSGSRSIINELNALRQRQSTPSAMDELRQTLEDLEHRLSGLTNLPPSPQRDENSSLTAQKYFTPPPPSQPQESQQLARIERRLSEIAEQFDNTVAQQNSDALFQRLGDLSQRIDALQSNAGLSDQQVEHLSQHISLLTRQVANTVNNLTHFDHRALAVRLDSIDDKLQAAQQRITDSYPELQSTLDRRFNDLTVRLDAQLASYQPDSDLLVLLDNRLQDISQQISNSMQQPAHELATTEAIRSLESQMAGIANHLAQPAKEISEIQPRLDRFEQSLLSNQEAFFVSARQATEQALTRIVQQGSNNDSIIARQLTEDIKLLETFARNADGRNAQALDTIQTTLQTIVSRLAKIENSPGSVSQPQPKAPLLKTEPRSPVATHQSISKPTTHEAAPVPFAAATCENETVLDLNSIMKRVREERRNSDDQADNTIAQNSRADLISAARRAAQMAADETQKITAQTDAVATEVNDAPKRSISDLFNSYRKPIILAISAVMIAVAGLQVGAPLLKKRMQTALPIDAIAIDTQKTASIPVTENHQPELSANSQLPEPVETAAAIPTQPSIEPQADINHIAEPEPSEVHPQLSEIPPLPEEISSRALREAATSGDVLALNEIGNQYMDGVGVPADYKTASLWYQSAAERGFAPAQYRLGNLSEKGLGMPRDLAVAEKWYRLAAEQGNANAMHNLGVQLASGANGTPDHVEALRWFTDAANHNIKDSQYNLGILAAKGIGTPVNLMDSYKWFALAAKSGDTDAADKRDQIGDLLSAQQLEQVKNTVEHWQAIPLNDEANNTAVPAQWLNAKSETTVDSSEMKKAVRNIQLILQKNGYETGSADGIMGTNTRKAIAEFQKEHGLEATGEVDQNFAQLLLEKNK